MTEYVNFIILLNWVMNTITSLSVPTQDLKDINLCLKIQEKA